MTDSSPDGLVEPGDLGVALADGVDDARDAVVLPVGRSDVGRVEALASTAAEVGGLMQSTVCILHVFTRARFERVLEQLDHPADATPDPDAAAEHVKPVRMVARQLDTPLRNYGSTMTIMGRVGETVSEEIVAAAEDIDAKQVLIGGRRRTPIGKVKAGSTAQRVLLDAPCPVTFVRDEE
ncbi:universal stress protein [Halorussus halobius]|uniref:universal stress protein n=1 Tax=Halorussus halobius TaxID=1710537 RepID=UPI001091F2D6|nr:universal stress protein [Halorussus halobius]